MNNIHFEKRAIDASLGELADAVIAKLGINKQEEHTVDPMPAVIRGKKEAAKYFNICDKTFNKFINDRRFDPAIKKEGNLILVDVRKFMEVFGSKKGGRRY